MSQAPRKIDYYMNREMDPHVNDIPLSHGHGKGYHLRSDVSMHAMEPSQVVNGVIHFTTEENIANTPLTRLCVLDKREDQTAQSLLPVKQRGSFPVRVEPGDALPQHRVHTFPMEQLLLNGFMSPYANDVKEMLRTVSGELQRDASFIQSRQQLKLEAGNAAKRVKKAVNPEETTGGTHKTFNWQIPAYDWNMRTGKNYLALTIEAHKKDKQARYDLFYAEDVLEGEEGEVEGQHRAPSTSKMFVELEEAMGRKYAARVTGQKDAASKMPRFDDEPPIPAAYIDQYRRRPNLGDETCSRNASFHFYTYHREEYQRYVGKVFWTPRERREGHLSCNTQKLCIDCILHDWTMKCLQNVQQAIVPEMQFNYFTVLVERGQYAGECMLPCIHNQKPTGIIGCVPEYNAAKRVPKTIKLCAMKDGEVVRRYTTTYLAETGMDF